MSDIASSYSTARGSPESDLKTASSRPGAVDYRSMRMNLGLKLGGGFACVVGLALLIFGIGAWGAGRQSTAHTAALAAVPSVLQAGDLKGALSDAHYSQAEETAVPSALANHGD